MGKKKGIPIASEGDDESPNHEEVNEDNTTSATVQDVLAAISALSDNVDKRFTELSTTITSLKADVSNFNARVTTTEEASVSHKKHMI